MEFDEINALINIEREKYQHDLRNGSINMLSKSIKQTKQQIQAQWAEKAAMEQVKYCTHEVYYAMMKLNAAMAAHATQLKITATL